MIAPTAISGLRIVDGVVVAGAFPAGGIGYAFHAFYAEWHTVTVGVAIAASASNDAGQVKNYLNIAGLVGFAKYAFIGTMVNIVEDARWWYLLAGVDVLSVMTVQQAAIFRAERARKNQATQAPETGDLPPANPSPLPLSVQPPPVQPLPVQPLPVQQPPDTTAP